MTLIPVPPEHPSRDWLQIVAIELMRMKPDLSFETALRCAELAHDGTWLMEPREAAHWWLLAIDAAARDMPQLRGGQSH